MIRIDIKTYNHLVLQQFVQQLNNNPKLKSLVKINLLPAKVKNFVVKKSPHVFGRSKEKYYLKVYCGTISLKSLRKKDILFFLLLFKSLKYKEELGLKLNLNA